MYRGTGNLYTIGDLYNDINSKTEKLTKLRAELDELVKANNLDNDYEFNMSRQELKRTFRYMKNLSSLAEAIGSSNEEVEKMLDSNKNIVSKLIKIHDKVNPHSALAKINKKYKKKQKSKKFIKNLYKDPSMKKANNEEPKAFTEGNDKLDEFHAILL